MNIDKLKSVGDLVNCLDSLNNFSIDYYLNPVFHMNIDQLEQFRQLCIQDYVNSLHPIGARDILPYYGEPKVKFSFPLFDLSDVRNK